MQQGKCCFVARQQAPMPCNFPSDPACHGSATKSIGGLQGKQLHFKTTTKAGASSLKANTPMRALDDVPKKAPRVKVVLKALPRRVQGGEGVAMAPATTDKQGKSAASWVSRRRAPAQIEAQVKTKLLAPAMSDEQQEAERQKFVDFFSQNTRYDAQFSYQLAKRFIDENWILSEFLESVKNLK